MLLAGSHWNQVVCGYSARNLTQQGAPMNQPRIVFLCLVAVLGLLLACQQFDPSMPTTTKPHAIATEEATATLEPTITLAPQPAPPAAPEATVLRDQTAVPTRSGFPVSPENASSLSSDGSSAEFGLEEFPHFPVSAIVRISTPAGTGSGFIFLTREDTAFVMTNAHVVADQLSITVRVRNAEEHDAVLLGGDQIVDIAVLSVCCSDSFEEIPLEEGLRITEPAPWSDNANTAWVGDPLVVVGYPRGSYDLVANSGKIHTTINTTSGMRIVHDAVAEPGNSGSPILSPEGRLMGVHFAGSIHGDEYSFVVPFDEAAYWSSLWLPRTDPAEAVVPVHQGDVTIKFTNKGIALLAAAASSIFVPDRGFEIEMAPDSSGYVWTMFKQ